MQMSAGQQLVAEAIEPSLSRRQVSGGGESARSLLFTVLGEFVLTGGGVAWTSAFIELLDRLGVAEKACRQALTRTAADGWLVAERAGRRTSWRLTPAAERLLTEGTVRIFSFSAIAEQWDGRWTLLLARVPESDRAARHLLRSRLGWLGFGNAGGGAWLSPHVDRVSEVEQVLAAAGITGQLFIAEHQGTAPLAELVGQAWDLAALERGYAEFIAEFASDAGDPLTRVTELVHAWRRFPFIDPELPAQVLPAGWIGGRAAELFSRQHAAWLERARGEWQLLGE